MNMTMTISHADDFTRSHPVLTGKRKGTTLRERLERISDKARKASVREVIRRVGGLEVKAREPRLLVFVIRRVGG